MANVLPTWQTHVVPQQQKSPECGHVVLPSQRCGPKKLSSCVGYMNAGEAQHQVHTPTRDGSINSWWKRATKKLTYSLSTSHIYIMQSQGLCSFNLAPVSLALWHLQWKRAWVVQARQLQQLQPRQWCQGGKLQQPEQPLFQEHKEGSAGSSPCSCWLCFELFVAAGASWSCVWSRKNCSSLNPMNSIYFLFWSHIRGQ